MVFATQAIDGSDLTRSVENELKHVLNLSKARQGEMPAAICTLMDRFSRSASETQQKNI